MQFPSCNYCCVIRLCAGCKLRRQTVSCLRAFTIISYNIYNCKLFLHFCQGDIEKNFSLCRKTKNLYMHQIHMNFLCGQNSRQNSHSNLGFTGIFRITLQNILRFLWNLLHCFRFWDIIKITKHTKRKGENTNGTEDI